MNRAACRLQSRGLQESDMTGSDLAITRAWEVLGQGDEIEKEKGVILLPSSSLTSDPIRYPAPVAYRTRAWIGRTISLGGLVGCFPSLELNSKKEAGVAQWRKAELKTQGQGSQGK